MSERRPDLDIVREEMERIEETEELDSPERGEDDQEEDDGE